MLDTHSTFTSTIVTDRTLRPARAQRAHVTFATYASPVGLLRLGVTDRELCRIEFPDGQGHRATCPEWQSVDIPCMGTVASQLDAYFSGTARSFDLPIALEGTLFQREVWDALRAIPYGSTISYAGLAARIGRPNAVRAVGAACGANPIPIVIPCHRVIGADGRLTGFGGGLAAKTWLLAHEGARPSQLLS